MRINGCGTTALLCLVLTACASIPEEFEQQPGHAWPQPGETAMGAFFADKAPEDSSLSGVRLISDAQAAFLARYALAGQAQHTLDLQYYLWKGDTTGQFLLYRVFQVADRGVRVRILIDDIYHSGRDVAYTVIDQHPNVQVRVFNPMGNRGLLKNANYMVNKSRLNYRMHNKIFLVDNAVAVLGGRNIGDDYFGIDPKIRFHDLDVLAVGPAAQDAGAAFDTYWNSRFAVPIDVIKPEQPPVGTLQKQRAELTASLESKLGEIPYHVPVSPEEFQKVLDGVAAEMTWAPTEIIVDPLDRFEGGAVSTFVELGERLLADLDEEVVIQTAYLIPTREGIEQIARHTSEGKVFRIMTNSLMSNNHISVHAHYMKYRKPLIEAGVELYELRADNALIEHYKKTESRIAESHAGLHTKAFVVDGEISMIGSYNMDPRSRIWNSEIGLLIHSAAFASKVLAEMDQEFLPQNAWRVTLDAQGKTRWTGEGPEGAEEWSHDPDASAWRLMLARIISWLPIEGEL